MSHHPADLLCWALGAAWASPPCGAAGLAAHAAATKCTMLPSVRRPAGAPLPGTAGRAPPAHPLLYSSRPAPPNPPPLYKERSPAGPGRAGVHCQVSGAADACCTGAWPVGREPGELGVAGGPGPVHCCASAAEHGFEKLPGSSWCWRWLLSTASRAGQGSSAGVVPCRGAPRHAAQSV